MSHSAADPTSPIQATVLAFSGRIASGKTALSEKVASVLGWPRAAFGDYIRSVARTQNLPETRSVLQDLGANLIEQQGWDLFCSSVLRQLNWRPGEPLVIDGIRHAEVVSVLKRLVSPSYLFLVFVQTDEQTRRDRLIHRSTSGDEESFETEAHSTEIQVSTTLADMADIAVDGAQPLRHLVSVIVEWVAEHRKI